MNKFIVTISVIACLLLVNPAHVSSFTNDQKASYVIGQKDFRSLSPNGGESTANQFSFYRPSGIAFDKEGNLWVAELMNNRILGFYAPPPSWGSSVPISKSAGVVIGQKDFTRTDTNSGGLSANSLQSPLGMKFDLKGNLWVADAGNNRVLRYSAPFHTGQAADLVIGQKDFVSGEINSGGLSASSLNGPRSIILFGNELWISDYKNGRVLGYIPCLSSASLNATTEIPLCVVTANINTGEPANTVLGKKDFTTTSNPYPTPTSSLISPAGIVFDSGGNLWVADGPKSSISQFKPLDICSGRGVQIAECHQYLNELQNVYADAKLKTVEFRNGQTPAIVIGKSSSYEVPVGADTLNTPYYIAFDPHGNLWVSDFRNNRVLKYDNFPILLLAPTNGTR